LLKSKQGGLTDRPFGGFGIAYFGLQVGVAGEEDETGQEGSRE
jgi:hypothetical protein